MTLPAGSSNEQAPAVARAHDRILRQIHNKHVALSLRADEDYFFTTPGHCDCGTILGDDFRRERSKPNLGAKVERFRRKGWSSSKIERWLKDKEKGNANRPDPENDAANWKSLILSLLERTGADYVGLLLHMYSGDVDDEPITLVSTQDVPYTDLSETYLRGIQEDVLYRFHRGAA